MQGSLQTYLVDLCTRMHPARLSYYRSKTPFGHWSCRLNINMCTYYNVHFLRLLITHAHTYSICAYSMYIVLNASFKHNRCAYWSVFSLAYLTHVGQTSLQYRIPFDVATSSTYTMPLYQALNFAWGEPCWYTYALVLVFIGHCHSNQSLYRQIANHQRGVDDHRVGQWYTTIITQSVKAHSCIYLL